MNAESGCSFPSLPVRHDLEPDPRAVPVRIDDAVLADAEVVLAEVGLDPKDTHGKLDRRCDVRLPRRLDPHRGPRHTLGAFRLS